ncbi:MULTISPECIES: nuclear transport factor 2 family protein [unclassified Pseudonocardia]|uniref:nuclear transport factor 2 family protein n=1 Tax=unclassified Pseudonocardia TaxID=2619320 RepID=UPI0001FFE78B|nr:nuclear transport factor 2 family protein [Pseudonocardia sp. Ae707_Ps1]OLM17410.1 hypothetical protein Ae707Ps1_1669c [Pseudonocardia sp. Ae707_Ps1]
MTDPIGTLVDAHLDAWNGPAGPVRDAAVAEIYAPDVLVGEPDAARTGHAGMSEAIDALHAQVPGTAITRSGPVQRAQDLVTYTWVLGAEGRAPVASGRDVLLVRGGRITSLYVLIDTT